MVLLGTARVGTPPKNSSAWMRLNPGFQLLIPSRFRVGAGTGTQHGNKQRCWPGLPGRWGSLPPPSPRTSFPRLCVPDAAPHPDVAASVDSARKTNCSDTPRDSLAGILPTPTAGADDSDLSLVMDEQGFLRTLRQSFRDHTRMWARRMRREFSQKCAVASLTTSVTCR